MPRSSCKENLNKNARTKFEIIRPVNGLVIGSTYSDYSGGFYTGNGTISLKPLGMGSRVSFDGIR